MSTAKHRYAVGVDFGGTTIKVGLVNEHGAIEAQTRITTPEVSSQETWMEAVCRATESLVEKTPAAAGRVAGVGVGVPGFVDVDRGFIYDLPNVPGWKSVHLGPELEKKINLRVRVDNDVNAMALGECTFGAGRAYQHAVFLTLGTGVGGGLLLNNQIYRGAYFMAGEIGHLSIDMNGVKSPQGKGGLEQYIGNRRIVERAHRLLDEGRPSILPEMAGGDRSQITPKLIAQAARKGDALSLEIYDFVADCLAAALASVTYLIQPQAFIIGGGVAQAGAILFDPLRRHLDERLSPYFAERIVIKTAELGNDAGIVGSATLAFME